MILKGRYESIDTDLPFDWKLHKDNFVDYLEVIILPSGEIKYAVPDHKNALMDIAGVTDSDCPKEYYYSMIDWLIKLTNCVVVYTDYYEGNPNDNQLKSLMLLKEVGLFYGKV